MTTETPIRSESSTPTLRIVVKCVSDHIPGNPQDRLKTMGNLICQNMWQRDMDEELDFIRTNGFPSVDGEKVGFLFDTGIIPINTKPSDIPILVYRWNGKSMKMRQLTEELRRYVQDLPFKRESPAPPTGRGKSLSELRSEMTEEQWNEFMEHSVSQKFRYRRNISRTESEWLKSHLQAFDKIMQHHISRNQWHHSQLWKSQELWLDAHREKADTSNSTLVHNIIEQHQDEIKAKLG